MESVRKYRDVTLIGQVDQHFRQVSKERFTQFNIISDDLVAVEIAKHTVMLNKPIYTGFRILESSKLHVFKFFYEVLKRKFLMWSRYSLILTVYWLNFKAATL